jgi:putative transposase
MCHVLEVSRAGYYAWLGRPESPRAARLSALVEPIRRVHRESDEAYGSPRVYRELKSQGVACCEKTVAKLMRLDGLRAANARRFVVQTTDSRHGHGIAENTLDRRFEPGEPDRVWVADITYIATGEGWLYLAAVLDLGSRKVIGWATADHLRSELAEQALANALEHRRPTGPVLHHSDRGVQYACDDYQELLQANGFGVSMSRKGNCHDNAVMESFFGSLKQELVHRETYPDREEARRSLFEYIEVFYNRRRLHSTLGYVSPVQYEENRKLPQPGAHNS